MTGAMHKNPETGFVEYDKDHCASCYMCIMSCPYGILKYDSIHHKEIMSAGMQVTAQQTAQKISNAIQAGARRPDENGTTGQSASVTTFDYSKASKAQRDALKREIFAARARGEKLYPGK